jgi:thiamine-monophosphate kinase
MPGEFDFISWLRQHQSRSPLVRLGIGDDLAVLKLPADDLLLVGVDQMMDGVHFDSAIHTPRAIGRKAMNRNLSDCAAMACLPAAALATICLPKGVGEDYARELYLGMTEAGQPFDCPVVGGDTGSWSGKLVVSVTILGRSAGVEPVTRSGAKPGDTIYVTGPLGGSILGRHMTFEPRVKLARYLAGSGTITSMIDLSDGLSRDLANVCRQSGVGARVAIESIPVHDDALKMSVPNLDADVVAQTRVAFDHALHDGEDYELLFTSSGTPDVGTRIGEITNTTGIIGTYRNVPEPLTPRGWEHTL